MCGIAGFFNSKNVQTPGPIETMLSAIEYRGPDEIGCYHDENIAFGTARLSIIDIKSGQQPLSDTSQRYWIAYNGEVYNYKELRKDLERLGRKFSTHSDTEVVLLSYLEWGPEALNKFNGGYAMAIYDRVEKTLFLARDRYGKRPLFYTTLADGTTAFGSEMKTLLAHGGVDFSFDVNQLATIATLWTPVPGQSGFKNIKQLPPGHYLEAKKGVVNITPYFQLELHGTQTKSSYEECVEKTRTLLEDAVKIRLRSDVEVGTYLSGGLDSSIVTHLACKNLSRKVRSFSIAFEDEHYDEDTFQKEVSACLGTNHETLRISNSDIANAFEESIWHAEVPVFRNALVPMFLLSSMVRKSGIKVVLTGEGADESFLGYDIFKETRVRKLLKGLSSAEEKAKLVHGLYPWMEHFTRSNSSHIVALLERNAEEKIAHAFSHELRIQNSKFSLRLLKGFEENAGTPTSVLSFLSSHRGELDRLSDIEKAQFLEFSTLLDGYLLSSQGDRMSFGHGVESRCPFMDFNVVSWAATLPEDFKLKGGFREKSILKDAFMDVLPERIINRFKQPYRAPDSMVFISESPPVFVEALMSENELSKIDFINTGFIKDFTQALSKKKANEISPREDQAFLFLLSLLVLHRKFVKREGLSLIKKVKVTHIDGKHLKKVSA